MGGYKTILSPVDLGPNTEITLETARGLAEANGAKLILLHVVPLPVEVVGQPMLVEPLSYAQDEARVRLEHLARNFNRKVPVEVAAVIGDPVREILNAIEERDADLVVMATHSRTGLSHFFLGSVTARIVRDSPVPVLAVPVHHRRKSLTSVVI